METLNFPMPTLVLLAGPNGAGKTPLHQRLPARARAGVAVRQSGQGLPLPTGEGLSVQERSDWKRERVRGWCFIRREPPQGWGRLRTDAPHPFGWRRAPPAMGSKHT